MSGPLEAESILNDRYKTTIPDPVRRALRLEKNDKIRYTIRPNGEVVLARAEVAHEADPLLGQFLGLLAQDMTAHPNRSQGVDTDVAARMRALVGGIEMDLDTPQPAGD